MNSMVSSYKPSSFGSGSSQFQGSNLSVIRSSMDSQIAKKLANLKAMHETK